MRQLTGPRSVSNDTRALKFARGMVILAALAYVLAGTILRSLFVSLGLGSLACLAWGIYLRSGWLIAAPSLILLAQSLVPGREIVRSIVVSLAVAVYLARASFWALTVVAACAFAVGLATGQAFLAEVGFFGLIPFLLRYYFDSITKLPTYEDVHLAGTRIVNEKEAIDRAQFIRSEGSR